MGEPDSVPSELVTEVSPFLVAMKGTTGPNPRCVALTGTVGQDGLCSIYPQRSSTCRAFTASWAHGEHEPDCDRARARHGLAPLTPADWEPRSPLAPSRAA